MGKGDIRSRRGKLFRGTYGNSRRHDTNKPTPNPAPLQTLPAATKPRGGKEAA